MLERKGNLTLLSRWNIMNYTLIPRKKQLQYRIKMRTMKIFVKSAKDHGNFLTSAGTAGAAKLFVKSPFLLADFAL